MPLIAIDALTKRYPARRHRARRADPRARARDHRAGRRERRRQEHPAAHPPRAPRADLRSRRRVLGDDVRTARARRCAGSSATCPSPTAFRRTRRATDFVGQMGRLSGLPGRRRARTDRRGPAPRRAVRGALPADRRLLDRHEAAGQARPGAGPRPAAAAARRADQRPRPGRVATRCSRWSGGPAPSSASRSSSPATCSARSSGSATSSSRSTPGGSSAPRRSARFTERTGTLVVEVDDGAGRSAATRSSRAWPPGRGRWSDRARSGRPATSGRGTSSVTRSPTMDLPLVRLSSGAAGLEELFRSDPPAGAPRRGPAAASTTSATRRYDGPRLGRCAVDPRRCCVRAARGGLRDRPRRAGQDRAVHASRSSACCRRSLAVGIAALAAQAGAGEAIEEASPISHANYQGIVGTCHDAVLRRPGPGAVRARPALRRRCRCTSRGVLTRTDYALARAGWPRASPCSSCRSCRTSC